MPKIASEDATTFVIEKDDGTTSQPIAKTGSPDLYKSLSMGGNPIDQTIATGGGNWAPAGSPIAPVLPKVGSGQSGSWAPDPISVAGEQGAMNGVTKTTPIGGTSPLAVGSKVTNQSTTIGAGALKEQAAAADTLKKSMLAEENAKEAGRNYETELLKMQTTETAIRNEELRRKEERRALEKAKKQQEVDALTKEFNGAKIDPKHLWGDEGTGNKLLAAIGIALGAVGQGLTGKENGAIAIVNSAIQRDIDIQKSMIDKMGKGVEMARGGLNDFMDVLGDDRAAESAEWVRQLEWYKTRLETIKSSNASSEAKARVEKEMANVDMQLAQRRAELEKNVHETVTETAAAKPADNLNPDGATAVQLREQENMVNELGKFAKLAEDTKYKGLGSVEGRMGVIADYFGISDPEARVNRGKLIQMVNDKAKAQSGAGVSNEERALIATSLMGKIDNEAAFKAMLGEETRRLNAKVDATRQSLANLRLTIPNDTRTWKPRTGTPMPGR